MLFKTRLINIVDESKIVFIVGEKPGRQRLLDSNGEVFHGNRTGDFIEKIIEGKQNIYLTNILNYQVVNHNNYFEGLLSLKRDIFKLKPIKIIILGEFAKENFNEKILSYIDKDIKLVYLKHPSYILRFNKDKKEYIGQLTKELE